LPEISRFYGIVIRMYFGDHSPPHFHAIYAGKRAVFELPSLEMTRGDLPSRARSFVVEWGNMHLGELLRDWELASRDETPNPIAPLE
jgi:hypothetical protein